MYDRVQRCAIMHALQDKHQFKLVCQQGRLDVVERLVRRQKHTVNGVVLQGVEVLLERVGVLAPRVLSSAGKGIADAPLLERLACCPPSC